jgi:phage FluMu protein Com
MFTSQSFQFVHQVYPGNDTITESRCPHCGALIAAATDDKYLAIAESAHKCRVMSAPRLRHEDLSRLH